MFRKTLTQPSGSMAWIEPFSSECGNRRLLFIAGLFVCKKRKSYQYLFHLVLYCNQPNYSTVSTMAFHYNAQIVHIIVPCFVDRELLMYCSRIIEALTKKLKDLFEAQRISRRIANIHQYSTAGSLASFLPSYIFTCTWLKGMRLNCFMLWAKMFQDSIIFHVSGSAFIHFIFGTGSVSWL